MSKPPALSSEITAAPDHHIAAGSGLRKCATAAGTAASGTGGGGGPGGGGRAGGGRAGTAAFGPGGGTVAFAVAAGGGAAAAHAFFVFKTFISSSKCSLALF